MSNPSFTPPKLTEDEDARTVTQIQFFKNKIASQLSSSLLQDSLSELMDHLLAPARLDTAADRLRRRSQLLTDVLAHLVEAMRSVEPIPKKQTSYYTDQTEEIIPSDGPLKGAKIGVLVTYTTQNSRVLLVNFAIGVGMVRGGDLMTMFLNIGFHEMVVRVFDQDSQVVATTRLEMSRPREPEAIIELTSQPWPKAAAKISEVSNTLGQTLYGTDAVFFMSGLMNMARKLEVGKRPENKDVAHLAAQFQPILRKGLLHAIPTRPQGDEVQQVYRLTTHVPIPADAKASLREDFRQYENVVIGVTFCADGKEDAYLVGGDHQVGAGFSIDFMGEGYQVSFIMLNRFHLSIRLQRGEHRETYVITGAGLNLYGDESTFKPLPPSTGEAA